MPEKAAQAARKQPTAKQVYTDGSASPDNGTGGWAVVCTNGEEVIRTASGSATATTASRMELQGVIEALKMLPRKEKAVIRTDHDSIVSIANRWGPKWRTGKWQRESSRIKDADLVEELLTLADSHPRCRLEWIRGHSGDRWNDKAHKLAGEARRNVGKSLRRRRTRKTR